MSLRELPNIGIELERQLHEAGINNEEQLIQCGSRNAWLKIQEFDTSACINRLYSLEGAIQHVRKNLLATDVITELKEFYRLNKLK